MKKFVIVALVVLSLLFTFNAFADKKDDNLVTVKKDNYTFTIELKPDGADKGKIIFKVTTPKTAKINKEYPNKLKLAPNNSVTLDKTKLTGKDAKTLSKDTLEMELGYKVADTKKGGSFDAKMKFGVCNMKGGEVFSCQFFTEKHKVVIPKAK